MEALSFYLAASGCTFCALLEFASLFNEMNGIKRVVIVWIIMAVLGTKPLFWIIKNHPHEYVSSLIKAIMQFMGRTISAGTNVTVAFIRWVLNLFVSIISTQAVHYACHMKE